VEQIPQRSQACSCRGAARGQSALIVIMCRFSRVAGP